MSHLTTFKNNSLTNTNKEMLAKAISEIQGLSINYSIKNIKNTWINETVDAGFVYNSKAIAVGLRFEESINTETGKKEEVAVVAGDFYGTGLRQKEITNKIAQIYQKHRVIDVCQDAMWTIDQDEIVEEDGEIVIQAYRYA